MSNADKKTIASILSTSFIVAGVVILIGAGKQLAYANASIVETSDGAYLQLTEPNTVSSGTPMLQTAPRYHAAAPVGAPVGSGTASVQLFLGMLILLIGFFFHALLIMPNERPILSASGQRKRRSDGMWEKIDKHLDFYWIEKTK